jgi:FixJ family two-component response regulator
MNSDELVFIVDDDLIQNEIHSILLSKIYPEIKVKTFTRAVHAIHALDNNEVPTHIFLDLHMPGESETLFLDAHTNRNLTSDIYLMSSVPYIEDESLISTYPAVKGFISKPLLEHKIRHVFNLYA